MFLLLILPIALWLPMLIMTMETQHLISEMAEPPAGAPRRRERGFKRTSPCRWGVRKASGR